MASAPKAGRRFILAIDDDESIRELYAEQLPIIGFDVFCAETGTIGKKEIAKRVPDLILVDVMMEDQDGISLTREFRADPKTENVPIIVVSGLQDAAVLNDALMFGATDYLTKPFELDALRNKIDRALSKRQEKRP